MAYFEKVEELLAIEGKRLVVKKIEKWRNSTSYAYEKGIKVTEYRVF